MKLVLKILLLIPIMLGVACVANGENEATAVPNSPAGPALIMFYTDGWAPWQAMTPIVNGLEEEFADHIMVLRLNAAEEENERLMQTYGVRGHPSFVLLHEDGRVSQTFFGPQSEPLLRDAINQLLAD